MNESAMTVLDEVSARIPSGYRTQTLWAEIIVDVLGLDPGMSVERLREDLQIAARARGLGERSLQTDMGFVEIGQVSGWNQCLAAVRAVAAEPAGES